jgi:hypothetical protein
MILKNAPFFYSRRHSPQSPFEAGLAGNQPVNQSMFQNRAEATDSETMASLMSGAIADRPGLIDIMMILFWC